MGYQRFYQKNDIRSVVPQVTCFFTYYGNTHLFNSILTMFKLLLFHKNAVKTVLSFPQHGYVVKGSRTGRFPFKYYSFKIW